MAKKLVSNRDLFLQAFVELRKKKPLVYPKVKEIIAHCKCSKYRFETAFKGGANEFYRDGEAYLKKTVSKAELALLTEKNKAYDPDATEADCITDLRRIQEEHQLSFISRTFYRNEGKYSDATWTKYFGNMNEFRKQAGLELTRHQQALGKHIAKQAAYDVFREFYTMEMLPYLNQHEKKLSTDRYATVLVGSDFHDIDCDDFMLSVFIATAKRLQPDIIILNGDVFDCYDSSKYDKDVRQLKIVERFDYVKKRIFGPLRAACPKAQIDFILGNHEIRIVSILASKTPNLRVLLSDVMGLTLADVFGVKDFKINLISKLDLAAFTVHDKKNELKKNFRVYYDCFVAGHFKDLGYGMSGVSGHCHRPATETFTNLIRGKCSWVETGCMCITDAEYVQHRDKWTQSFLIAHIDTKMKTVNPEHIIVAGDQVVVHGVRYVRK